MSGDQRRGLGELEHMHKFSHLNACVSVFDIFNLLTEFVPVQHPA